MSKDTRKLGKRNKNNEWKRDAKNSITRRRVKRAINKTDRQNEKLYINNY